MSQRAPPGAVVLDTNIALDLLLFRDPSTLALAQELAQGTIVWHATAAMRAEFARVLGYPALQAWLARADIDADRVLAQFDHQCRIHPDVATGPPRCSDPDDQKFIDLALALRAVLLSKDHAVLRLRAALAGCGVTVAAQFCAAA